MASKRPDDETLGGGPGFQSDEQEKPRSPSGLRPVLSRGAMAPEASQGPWRERAFLPRSVLAPEEILEAMARSLRVTMTTASHPRVAHEALRGAWLPTLRQALEGAGGDGIDAWLGALLTPPAAPPRTPFFEELGAALRRMRQSRDVAVLEEEALKTIELVRRACTAEAPTRLSFKRMERELEGKLEVDQLLLIVASSEEELSRRLEEIGHTMEQLRDQIRHRPGSQPDGMYANFVRLKTELKVLDAELGRRRGAPPHPPG
jgi:hypothetical protein